MEKLQTFMCLSFHSSNLIPQLRNFIHLALRSVALRVLQMYFFFELGLDFGLVVYLESLVLFLILQAVNPQGVALSSKVLFSYQK